METHTSIKANVLAFDAATPRYTSYPPATAFVPGLAQEDYARWLATPHGDSLSLYIHIPFCARLCYYCGCHTTIANDPQRIEDYVHVLIKEIAMVRGAIPVRTPLSHIHFGGGSPTILPPAIFNRLMAAIREHFAITPDIVIAVEADPRQMSEARIATFAKAGVTRISLGVQDTDPSVLAAVNRPQPFSLSWDAVRLCHDYGIDEINIDLMYGLPGQTVDSITRTVETALTLKPDRVAFFGYAHVPWMKRHMSLVGDASMLPDPSLRYDLNEAGRTIFTDAGYLPIGIDHFARPADSMAVALGNRSLRRNFQGYTTDAASTLIGIGCSSISLLPQGYSQNIADLRTYQEQVRSGLLPLGKHYILNAEDRLRSAIISEIMCYMAVDLTKVCTRHHMDPADLSDNIKRLAPLVTCGLVECSGSFIRILHSSAARLAARCFDPQQEIPGKNRHSSAV